MGNAGTFGARLERGVGDRKVMLSADTLPTGVRGYMNA